MTVTREEILQKAVGAVLENDDPLEALGELNDFAIAANAWGDPIVVGAKQELLKRILVSAMGSPDPRTAIAKFFTWVQEQGFSPEDVQVAVHNSGIANFLGGSNPNAAALPAGRSAPAAPIANTATQPIVPPVTTKAASGRAIAGTATQKQSTPVTQPSPQSPPPEFSIPKPNRQVTACPEADRMGEGVVKVCEEYGLKVEYLGCNPRSPRIYSLKFKPWLSQCELDPEGNTGKPSNKGRGSAVRKFKSLLDEFIVHAGLPDNCSPIIRMRSGFIEIQVPKRKWLPCLLTDYVQPRKPGEPPDHPFQFRLGVDTDGELTTAKVIHSISGGATDGGKSGQHKSMITGKMIRHTTEEVRFLLIDFMGSFQKFKNAVWLWHPHGVVPSRPSATLKQAALEALDALRAVVEEKERRRKLFASLGLEGIDEYNTKFPNEILYYLFIFIDEHAMFRSALEEIDEDENKDWTKESPTPKSNLVGELDSIISLLGEQARKQGISLHPATQRPEANLLPSRFKANAGTRMAFRAESEADSKIILGISSDLAVMLEGYGDMWFRQGGNMIRLQGLLTTDALVVEVLKQGQIVYGHSRPRATPAPATDEPPQSIHVDDPDYATYQKLMALEAAGESEYAIAIALWGHEYKQPKDAGNGSSFRANQKRMAALKKKFAGATNV